MKQEEVVAIVGLSRSCYMNYEAERNVYPLDKLTAIAKTLDVKVVDLIDDYNVFLNKGQSKQILAIRKKYKLTQKQLAVKLDIPVWRVKQWEQDKVTVSKATYEKFTEIRFVL